MYDWEDKDGYGKLVKILNRLLEGGYNARMLGSKMFVRLFDPNGNYVCDAYSSTWHSRGLIFVQHWCNEIGTTFSPDKAYDMMIKYYDRKEPCDGSTQV